MDCDFPETFLPEFHDIESVKKITYKTLGNTKLQVSNLSLGTAQLALCYGTDMEEEGVKTVLQAIKSGINYIDTAPYYGEGKAETVLGKALRKVPRETYYIGTKVGRYTSDKNTMFDFSANKVIEGLHESLSRLGISYVDVIQVHDVEFAPNMDILVNETLPALQKIKECGLAKYIGITGYPVSKLKELMKLSRVKIHVVLSYSRYTLFDQFLLNYIEDFQKSDVGIINAAVLGMGLLTTGGPPDWHPVTPSLKEVCRQAAQYCEDNGVDISRLATAYSLSHPVINTHLIGMSNHNVLETNLDIAQNGLTSKEAEVLRDVLERYFDNLDERNWENIELQEYWSTLKGNKN